MITWISCSFCCCSFVYECGYYEENQIYIKYEEKKKRTHQWVEVYAFQWKERNVKKWNVNVINCNFNIFFFFFFNNTVSILYHRSITAFLKPIYNPLTLSCDILSVRCQTDGHGICDVWTRNSIRIEKKELCQIFMILWMLQQVDLLCLCCQVYRCWMHSWHFFNDFISSAIVVCGSLTKNGKSQLFANWTKMQN